jgi:hypothetical protein
VQLALTDAETFALLNLLTDTVERERYPLSPRVRTPCGILAKVGPMDPAPAPPGGLGDLEHRARSKRPVLVVVPKLNGPLPDIGILLPPTGFAGAARKLSAAQPNVATVACSRRRGRRGERIENAVRETRWASRL